MYVSGISFNGWYKLTNRQLGGLSPKDNYLFGVSTAQYQKRSDNIEGSDALYIKVNDKKRNEFVSTCRKFNIIPERVNI